MFFVSCFQHVIFCVFKKNSINFVPYIKARKLFHFMIENTTLIFLVSILQFCGTICLCCIYLFTNFNFVYYVIDLFLLILIQFINKLNFSY